MAGYVVVLPQLYRRLITVAYMCLRLRAETTNEVAGTMSQQLTDAQPWLQIQEETLRSLECHQLVAWANQFC